MQQRMETTNYLSNAPSSVINFTDKDKSAVARQLIEYAKDTGGEAEMIVYAKIIAEILEEVKGDTEIRESVLNYVDRSSGSVKVGSYVLTKMETSINYDYSHDDVWLELVQKEKEATEARKKREAFLKRIPYEGVADPNTGEILRRAVKTSTTVPKISKV